MPAQQPTNDNIIPIDEKTASALKPESVDAYFPGPKEAPKPWLYPPERPIMYGARFSIDPLDRFIPPTGFLRDFCEARACYETSPFFLLWAGLFTLATVTRRQVGLKWGEGTLYPNLYVFLCAPPGTVKKSTPIDLALDCLYGLPSYCLDEHDKVEAFIQTPNMLSGKGTPEALTELLAKRERVFTVNGAAPPKKTIDLGSQAEIVVAELTTFLNTSSYNEALVDRLTDLWDCRERAATEITKSRGRESVSEVFVNMLAGTNPDSLRESLPAKAFGGGFVSRTSLVFVPTPTRSVPIPYLAEGYPDKSDLIERLYWCVKNAKAWGPSGTYTLSERASLAYITFYHEMHDDIVENQYTQQHSQNRLTQLVLKVAMLVRMSRYEEGTEISFNDFELARKLMLFTASNMKYATEDNGPSLYAKLMNGIKMFIARQPDGKAIRGRLLKSISQKGFKASEMDDAIQQLYYCGFLKIGNKLNLVTNDSAEVYEITDSGRLDVTLKGEKEAVSV